MDKASLVPTGIYLLLCGGGLARSGNDYQYIKANLFQ
jgi:hypothetical protein